MGTGRLTIDTAALAANWQALNAAAGGRAGAVVKADAYGLGIQAVAPVLARAGARTFFVAVAEEGAALRAVLGDGPEIFVFSGHMAGDAPLLADAGLIPLLNDRAQWTRHRQALPGHPFGVQLDTGMNRLGMESAEWSQLRGDILAEAPRLLMSHLACADEPDHSMNARQLSEFLAMTEGAGAPRSLAATGGTLLDASFHFDLTRPGVGLYGGMPFADACPVAHLSLPVIQVRDLAPGESVGYGNAWIADAPARIATVAAGYADGLIRAMGGRAALYAGDIPCPLRGRVSMDLLTVDVTALKEVPGELALLNHRQGVDEVAAAAGTIGYEILTSLGARYRRGEVSA